MINNKYVLKRHANYLLAKYMLRALWFFYVLCEYIPYISKINHSTSYGIGTTKRDCNDDVNDNDNKNRMKQMTPRK